MKIRNDSTHPALPPQLLDKLRMFRLHRGFDAKEYVEQKTSLLTKYVNQYGLEAVVLGISGGIDSAVVLALAAQVPGLEIFPVQLPALDNTGVTGQEEATRRGNELCKTFGLKPIFMDMTPAVQELSSTVMKGMNETGHDFTESDWGIGQLVSYARTPVVYYVTTVLTDNGKKAFILGTTNYSEGSYLGYLGKASDAMVDVQLISDLHKSEVYQVAEYLGIPDSIIEATPTGDMFDATTDEDVFGASYDFVELYLEYLGMFYGARVTFLNGLSADAREYFYTYSAKLDALHSYNKHKYLAGSPAVHLDINSPQTWENFWKKTTWKG